MKKCRFKSVSETGLVRKENQDHVLCLANAGLFAVADGMGGGADGALASEIVCEELAKGAYSGEFPARLDEIAAAVAAANERILAHAKKHGFRQMGSTVAVLAIDDFPHGRGAIGYVGDSRVYRIRDGAAALLTRDHSIGAELESEIGNAAAGRFSSRSNPLAHILTRVVGMKEKLVLEWRKIDVSPGDRFVVCSDGVHDVIETEELAGLIAQGDLSLAADSLGREVVKRGAPDNYSFAIVEIGG